MDEILTEIRELRQIIQGLQGLQLRDAPPARRVCEGVTGRGTACRNRAVPDSCYCRMHGERPARPEKPPRVKKAKKVQPEHVHVDGVVCPLCEMHGDILDPGLPDEEFEGVLPLSGGGAPFP